MSSLKILGKFLLSEFSINTTYDNVAVSFLIFINDFYGP